MYRFANFCLWFTFSRLASFISCAVERAHEHSVKTFPISGRDSFEGGQADRRLGAIDGQELEPSLRFRNIKREFRLCMVNDANKLTACMHTGTI